MNSFHSQVSACIARKKLSIIEMARYCGLDRSSMYKIVHGSRTPASLETVYHMAEFLRLSPAETKELVKLYKIAIDGYDTYFRRQQIKRFLIFEMHQYECSSSTVSYYLKSRKRKHLSVLHNACEVRDSLHVLLLEQTDAIRIIGFPENESIRDELFETLRRDKKKQIIHLVNLSGRNKILDSGVDYNVDLLGKILPFCSFDEQYQCSSYYDQLAGEEALPFEFRNLVLGKEYVLASDARFQKGILYHDIEISQATDTIFNQMLTVSKPMLQCVLIDDILKEVKQLVERKERCTLWSLNPLFIGFMNELQIRQIVKDSSTSLSDSLEKLAMLLHQFPFDGIDQIFSADGFSRFLEEGTISFIPQKEQKPLSIKARTDIASRFLLTSEKMKIHVARKGFSPAHQSMIAIGTEDAICFLFKPVNDAHILLLQGKESGMVTSFNDYFHHLDEDDFYPEEEGHHVLAEILKDYKKSH